MIRRTACLVARGNDPCRNLALEKKLMDTLPESTAILYMFQSRASIVLGRNQNPWHECKVDSFLEAGGIITRRLSGGCAHYMDMGCLCFSLILPKTEFDIARQTAMLNAALAPFGLQGELSHAGRMISAGRVFCQNAFYKAGSGAIHHGVFLLRADMDALEHYLKPRPAHAPVPGLPSPSGKMINLRELNPDVTTDALEQCLYQAFCRAFRAEPTWLDEQMMDSKSLNAITLQFENPEWVYPEKVNYDFTVSERFPWGSVTVLLLRDNGVIRAAKIFSDAMEAALFPPLEQGLVGCPFLIGAITTRFDQRLDLLRDPRLLQIAGDVCTLLCGRIRAMDRGGQ